MEDRFRQMAASQARKRIGRTLRFLALMMSAITACHDSTAPKISGLSVVAPETVHFTAVPSGYHRIAVPVTVRNDTGQQLHLGYCSESLERFTTPNWRFVWGPICLAVVTILPPIEPGASLTITVNAEDTAPGYPGFRFTDSQNIYRVKLGLFFIEEGKTSPVPDDANASNPFQVVP